MFNKRLIAAVPEAKKHIVLNVLFQWLGLLCSVAATLTICQVVTGILNFYSFDWMLYIIMLLVSALLRALFVHLAGKQAVASSHIVKKTMRRNLFEKLASIGPGYTALLPTAEIVSLTNDGTEQLESYFANYLPQFFYALIAPVTLFVITVGWNLTSALVLLLCVPLIPASIVAVQKFAKKLLARYWGQYTGLSDSFLENLQGLTTLKVYDADESRHQKMNEEAENFRKITMRVLIMQLNSISVMDLVAYGGAAAGILCALSAYASGQLSLFHTLAFILLSAEFFLPMRLLGSYFHVSMNGSAAADRMFKILDTEVPVRSEKLTGPEVRFSATDLSFDYDSDKAALDNVSFELPAAGFIGICGASGSGKSTFAGLLSGKLTDPSGKLSVNGIPEKDVDTADLLKRIGVLSVESTLFEGTVADNLKLAKAGATDAEMKAALDAAGLLDELGSLDHKVSEQGASLSGGQRQRLALARLLLKNPQVFILDEATSAVDPEAEKIMMDTARKLSKDHLVLCISHRLANLKDTDEIYVFKNGRIVEKGTDEQLRANTGEYSSLLAVQDELESWSRQLGKEVQA